MRRYIAILFLTLLFCSSSYAEEELQARSSKSEIENKNIGPEIPLAELSGEPSAFVNQSVNAITGQYHEMQTDAVVCGGPEPLTFQRLYVSSYCSVGGLCNGWNINNFGQVLFLKTDPKERKYSTLVWDHGGGYAHYEGKYSGSNLTPSSLTISPEDLKKGFTNRSSYQLAGATNIKNNRLTFTEKNKELVCTLGDGTKRNYQCRKYSGNLLDLCREVRPNGNQIFYEYAPNKNEYRIGKIKLANRQGTCLSTISVDYISDEQMDVCTSDNRKISYFFKKYYAGKSDKYGRSYLSKVVRSDGPTESYEYSEKNEFTSEQLTCKSRPDGRYIINEYYQRGSNQVGETAVKLDKRNLQIGRVMLQKAPVGPDATPIITHRYFYHINEKIKKEKRELDGYTTVLNALNNRTDYYYSEDLRLTSIQRWLGSQIYTAERFFWGKNESPNSINLLSRSLELGSGWIQAVRTYDYDARGNVLQEKLWGNLSGYNVQPLVLDGNGIPVDNGCQKYTKFYTYTEDGRNLLVSEFDGRKAEGYAYFPDSNLVKSKMTWADNQIRAREFFVYDHSGVAVRQITDNGCTEDQNNLAGVSQRRIKYITPTASNPVGLPGVIEEKCVDLNSGQEILISKVVNFYSPQGWLIRQDHFGSDEVHGYSLEWEYDSMGHVTKAKNALGQVIEKRYDANGNLTFEQGPRRDCYKAYAYDFSDRLTRMDEFHSDGVRLSTTFRYDYLGNKTASVDPYGNETRYIYDELGRLVQTVYPQVLNESGSAINPTVFAEYDPLNRPWKQIDARGFSTTHQYTIYDKPFQKSNPDGTIEWFEYNLDGSLKKTLAPNGMATCYTYDYQVRLTKKEIFDPQGVLLSCSSWSYDAFNLLSETDPTGHVTQYQYDPAGRLKSVSSGDSLTTYEYDALGRKAKASSYYGFGEGEFTATVFVYDLLDRVTEEREEDALGNVLSKTTMGYDLNGNRELVQTGDNVTLTQYNAHNQPVKITDALGNETHIEYRHDFRNGLGQNVLQTITTDSMGQKTIKTSDALKRLVSVVQKNSMGALISQQEIFYDACGNEAKFTDFVIVSGQIERQVDVIFQYNSVNQLISKFEAVGTPEQKHTRQAYNKFGQKDLTIKPNGTLLYRRYDSQGRLASFEASDNSFAYAYEYNLLDQVVKVTDLMTNTATLRAYDSLGRLSSETLGNGLELGYVYDRKGRVTQLVLPDKSTVNYAYDAAFLREVARGGYTHRYESYDIAGNSLTQTLINQAGKLSYAYDKLDRLTQISHPQRTETVPLDGYDALSNVCKMQIKDVLGQVDCSFAYDDLYQLSSEQGVQSHTYALDSLYNRLSQDGKGYQVNSLNQILSYGEDQYTYDANGNLTNKVNGNQTVEYRYDALDRLISIKKDGLETFYTYDSFNRRLTKRQGEVISCYFYQRQEEIGAFESGKLTQLRLLGKGQAADIGATVAIELDGGLFAPLHDHNGNIVCLIDSVTGKAAESYRYTAFGETVILNADGDAIDESAINNPWRFSSKRFDPESGLTLFGERYYSSDIGRWITADPIGFADGSNLYAFVHNNPFYYRDPDGRCAFLIPLVGIVFGVTETAIILPTAMTVAQMALGTALVYGGSVLISHLDGVSKEICFNLMGVAGYAINNASADETVDQEDVDQEPETQKKGRRRGKDNDPKGGPPRRPGTFEYLPDPAATGSHTTLGIRQGRRGPFLQGATFDKNGKFKGRFDITDHGRGDHPNPHYHPATSPNSAKSPPKPISNSLEN